MKVRNKPYDKLNKKEQKIVKAFMTDLYNDKTMSNCPEIDGETPQKFWDIHRNTATEGENGKLYDGWKEVEEQVEINYHNLRANKEVKKLINYMLNDLDERGISFDLEIENYVDKIQEVE